MDIPDFKTCKVIKIEFNKQIIDRYDSKLDFRATNFFRAVLHREAKLSFLYFPLPYQRHVSITFT